MDELALPVTFLTMESKEPWRRETLQDRSVRQGLVILCVVVMVWSCSLVQAPKRAELVEQALPKGTSIPQNWAATKETQGSIDNDWLKSFNDSRLDSLVEEAIKNNLDLRQAAAHVEMARQNITVVSSKLKPQVNVALGGATARDEDHHTSYDSSTLYGDASWEIDLWGRLRAQRSSAEASFAATALDYAFARQSLAATTAKGWYLAIEMRQLVTLARQSVDVYATLLNLAKIKLAAGQVTELDVAEASASLNAAQNALRSIQGLYAESQRSLEVLIGRYPSAELEVAETFTPLPPAVQAGLPASLLERRPDIVAAERRVLAAFRAQEAARLALLPNIVLTVRGGQLSNELLSLARLNPWYIYGSLGALVPIYRGGALQAQVKIATAQQQQAVAQYGGVALKAFREVENSLFNENLYTQQLKYIEEASKERTEAVRIATLKYKAGATSLMPVLQLQTEEITSRAEVIKMRNALLVNRINLHLTLGGSFDSTPAVGLISEASDQ
jgi:outer membrane protein, multidrug efflux system